MTAVSYLLSRYPEWIGAQLTDPKDGVAGKYKWLPTVAEIKEEAEKLQNADVSESKRRVELKEQFALRDQIEQENKAEPLEYRKKVAETIKNVLRAHGFEFKGDVTTKPQKSTWKRFTDDELRAIYPPRTPQSDAGE